MKTSHHIVTRYQTTQFMSLEQLTNSKIQMKTTIYIYKKKLFEKDNIVSNSARNWTHIFVSELLRCDKIVINVLLN